jgi:hypothetical protein
MKVRARLTQRLKIEGVQQQLSEARKRVADLERELIDAVVGLISISIDAEKR